MARKTATERAAAAKKLVDRHSAAVQRARVDLAKAEAAGDDAAIAEARAKVAKATRWRLAARERVARYAPIATLDGIGARVEAKAAAAAPIARAADEAAAKAERQRERAKAPKPISSASIVVMVPSPWSKNLDSAEMRVSNPIKQLARRGDIDKRQARAAAWFRSVVEAAEAGGVGCIDYSAIRVDTSTRGGAPIMDDVLSAMEDHKRAAQALGLIGYRIVRAVVYEGRTCAEVSATWPTATVVNGSPDRQTREFIGRALREGLSLLDREFCQPLDPTRNYVERRMSTA